MKNTLLVIACLSLLCVGAKPRRTPRAAAPVVIPVTGTALGSDGRQYSFSGTLNLTVGDAPAPIPTPLPPPPIPGPGVSVDRVTDASGANITAASGGSLVWIRGFGMGSAGIVKVAGQACSVIDWQPWAISCKTPIVSTSQTGPVMVAPLGINPATSSFTFTLVGTPGPTPVPDPTPTPTPTPTPIPGPTPMPLPQPNGSVEWPPGTLAYWRQDALGFYRPVQPPYPWALPGKIGIDHGLWPRAPWNR